MSSQSIQTVNRLSLLKSIEDAISKHRSDNPDSNIPSGVNDAVNFLLDFYQNVEGWQFSSTKRLSERYNQNLIDNRVARMSCDY